MREAHSPQRAKRALVREAHMGGRAGGGGGRF